MRILKSGNILPAIALCAGSAFAQSGPVPGRDLLVYPVGLVAEAGALPGMLGIGLFNPAASRLTSDSVWRIGAAAMHTPSELAATAQAVGVSRRWRGVTLTASLLRAAVDGILRTDSDPLTTGNNIVYATQVMSLGASMRRGTHFTIGAAARLRSGQLDVDRRTSGSIDIGLVADSLPLDLRVAGSTFLWSPFSRSEESPTLLLSGDVRLAGTDSLKTARFGMALSNTTSRASEQFFFVSTRFQEWEVRGGTVRTSAYGEHNMRLRLGVGVHYGSYVVGLAREETPAGLAPSYQFVISSVLR